MIGCQLAHQCSSGMHCRGGILGRGTAKPAAGQRAPGLQRNLLETAILQGLLPDTGALALIIVKAGACLHPVVLQQAHLQLVGHQGIRQRLLQQRQLTGMHVGNPQLPHLAAGLELQPGVSDLLRLHQRIGAMQQQGIQILAAQTRQDPVHAGKNIVTRQVIALGTSTIGKTDTALGLQLDLRPQLGPLPQHLTKYLLGLAQGIDVGMIEAGDADLEGRIHGGMGLLQMLGAHRLVIPATAKTHTTEDQTG